MQRLRYALLFDGRSLERWHLRCLEGLEPYAELTGAIAAPLEAGARSMTRGSPFLRRYAERLTRRLMVDVTGHLADIPSIALDDLTGEPEPTLDFVLRLGRVAIPRGLAAASRHGVWYFEHERELDLLPFFREVHDGESITAAALVQVGHSGHDVWILEQGRFPTNKLSYEASRERVEGALAAWPARVCRQLMRPGAGGSGPQMQDGRARAVEPERRMGLGRYRVAIIWRRLALARERLFRHPQWNIGILHVPAGGLLAPGAYVDSDVEWFPLADRKGFLADPFAVLRDERVHVVCEYYSYRESKGELRALEYDADGFSSELVTVLSQPTHMSYPFLLEHAGGIYCIPETAAEGEVVLLRADEYPRRWSRAATLVADFPGLDATVFPYEGRWWLLSTRSGPLEDVELWAWHAPELMGPWIAHARNPVKTDICGARPAGPPFVHDGALYRPAQDGSRTYGGRITLHRVTQLTPTEFAEQPVTVLEASPAGPFPVGPHTLTPIGDAVLVDGRRTVFAPDALRAFLRIWAADLADRRRRRRSVL